MTDVRFYHLTKQNLDQALPLILTKAYKSNKNILVRLSDKKEVERMNAHLWAYRSDSFLPHGCHKEGNAQHQPIWLTHKEENPNNAQIVILAQGAQATSLEGYDLCCIMLDGRSDDQVQAARIKWKAYKEEGLDITYWMQNESGGWEQKT
ncbi:MAG: DNA polymerase III subunit chi [Alphaproteobacteria bacterium]|nr:DNA polymerase III subunit chi [Alphaproteobacteria bacterium]NCQ88612.1 DNA polymerase III subunit chi [Alphaproteobacteria bacterium]NCT06155.1 DNA polymerase III subunit chi [Alphaproteobacteria bacterium]